MIDNDPSKYSKLIVQRHQYDERYIQTILLVMLTDLLAKRTTDSEPSNFQKRPNDGATVSASIPVPLSKGSLSND